MSDENDFIGATDKPALIAFSTPEWMDATRNALHELGYKVHTAATHSDFTLRFTQVRYQVVIIEELFGAAVIEENLSLATLQVMPMAQRRHATIIVLGNSFTTFMPLQAFELSVHAVINASELFLLNKLLEKAIADNEAFLKNFRDAQASLFATGKKD